jgi:23S rRNA pseudouridine2604 synthase
MGFTRGLVYFLVHQLHVSNKAVQQLLHKGHISVNGDIIYENVKIGDTEEIKVKDEIIREAKQFVYLKFHKPKGFESTLNVNIETNIGVFFKDFTNLSIAGRLDKASEGLMLLSNNGKWVQQICHPSYEKEKMYQVWVNEFLPSDFEEKMSTGIRFWNYTTKACKVKIMDATCFYIWLSEGKNRQIRNMCEKLGVEVIRLKRLQIDTIHLGELKEGVFEKIGI